MKIAMFFTLILGLNSMVFAKDIKCEFVDTTFVHQFSLEIKDIDTSLDTFQDVEFDFMLKRAGRDSKVERYTTTRSGTVQTFAAGTFYKHETVRLFNVSKGAELEYINILVDMGPLFTSTIRFLNGMTYAGSCKTF
jgi:hypothetical protein